MAVCSANAVSLGKNGPRHIVARPVPRRHITIVDPLEFVAQLVPGSDMAGEQQREGRRDSVGEAHCMDHK